MSTRSHSPAPRLLAAAACLLAATAAHAEDASPFDALVAEYRPHLDVADPLGFGVKVRAITADEYRFWRGTKGLFFAWCKDHAADFLADATDRVPSHGDVHPGNLGVYACGPKLGDVACGLVDFDDSCELPFQIDLLEALVTNRILAAAIHASPADADRAALDAYRAALLDPDAARRSLAAEPIVAQLFAKATKPRYADQLAKFCEADGTFRTLVGKPGKPSDLLEPIIAADQLDAFAAGLVEAAMRDATLASWLAGTDAASVRGQIVGVARRIRLGSSGSQGLEKYLVRLRRPGMEMADDLLIYFKQQIPTAAMRAGFVGPIDATPGERARRMTDALATPPPIVNGSAAVGGESFLVSLHEPWSGEIDAEDIDSPERLESLGRITGWTLGVAHGGGGRGATIARRIDDVLTGRLGRLADEYVASLRRAFARLAGDPRARALSEAATAAVAGRSGG